MRKLILRFGLCLLAVALLSSCGGAIGYDQPSHYEDPPPGKVGASGVPH